MFLCIFAEHLAAISGECRVAVYATGTKGCRILHFAHAVFPSTCAELVKVTGGELADVA